MSRSDTVFGISGIGFPRVSGDEPAAKEDIAAAREFSPRERG